MITDSQLMQSAVDAVARNLFSETWMSELMSYEAVPIAVRDHMRSRARTLIEVLQALGFGPTNADIREKVRAYIDHMRRTLNGLEQDIR